MEKNNNIHPAKYKKSSSFMSRGGFLSILLLALSMMVACEKDDSDLSAYMEKGAEEGTETPPASRMKQRRPGSTNSRTGPSKSVFPARPRCEPVF